MSFSLTHLEERAHSQWCCETRQGAHITVEGRHVFIRGPATSPAQLPPGPPHCCQSPTATCSFSVHGTCPVFMSSLALVSSATEGKPKWWEGKAMNACVIWEREQLFWVMWHQQGHPAEELRHLSFQAEIGDVIDFDVRLVLQKKFM